MQRRLDIRGPRHPVPGRRRRRVAAALTALVFAGVALWLAQRPRQVVFLGGPIFTMTPEQPTAEAVAISGDRIAFVGSADDARGWASAHGAEIVDLGGHALLPGFIDAHSHFPAAGLNAIAADLTSPPVGQVTAMDQLVERLRKRAESASDGDWVWGIGYDDTLLHEKRHPTREDLDRVSNRHPVGVLHVSGHLAAANSKALEELGIRRDTPDPEGGRIRRSPASGEPTGVLEESAAEAMTRALIKPGMVDAFRILRRGAEVYSAAGVTTAQVGLATAEQIRALTLASRVGLVPMRLVLWPAEEVASEVVDGKTTLESHDPLWVRFGAVKLVADGSIQGYTAYLTSPYHVPPPAPEDRDATSYRGYPRIAREALADRVLRFHRAGWQVAVHGNGDATIDDILAAFAAAQAAAPRADVRPIVVHSQTAREDQLDRMRELDVIPTFFVLHTYYWGDRHRDVFLGPERAARISPTRSAKRRGIPFTLHADTPVAPMEPLRIVWAAVNRRTTSGVVLGEEQRLDVHEALAGITIDAARQHFEEKDKGSLEVGKLADLVILDRSPLKDPATIDRIRVLETIVGGRSVYRAPDAPHDVP